MTEEMLPGVAQTADVLRDYGVRNFLCIHFAAPVALGALETADPLDPGVQKRWSSHADTICRYIPDFDGFADNVILQSRNGPFDFHPREPVSTGRQTHIYYLMPVRKEALDFDTHAKGKGSTVTRVVDRSRETGTGYAMQYNGPVGEMYDNLETFPDEFLLFFTHVPYTHVLHSGKTVIQHIYSSPFEFHRFFGIDDEKGRLINR